MTDTNTPRPSNDGRPWTREQLILAFDLYCRVPFDKTTTRNPLVRELASRLGRTPASVARKLGNFGAFDPTLAAQNISGLAHGSKLDRAVWDEFHNDWGGLVSEAERLREATADSLNTTTHPNDPTGPSERVARVKQRLHQTFFRDSVISSYNSRCCVTGLPVAECLVAGHIIPWSVDEKRRADPTNGLCMSATFDRLFDRGLITVDNELRLVISRRVLDLDDISVASLITPYHNRPIMVPTRFAPDTNCLMWHRENRFDAT